MGLRWRRTVAVCCGDHCVTTVNVRRAAQHSIPAGDLPLRLLHGYDAVRSADDGDDGRRPEALPLPGAHATVRCGRCRRALSRRAAARACRSLHDIVRHCKQWTSSPCACACARAAWLVRGEVQKLVVVISGFDSKTVLERWVFSVETDKSISSDGYVMCPQRHPMMLVLIPLGVRDRVRLYRGAVLVWRSR
jgi:hypothetical protein